MADDLEFEEPAADGVVATAAQYEPKMYGNVEPKAPNCFFLPLGRRGYLSWQSDNHIAVLALMMMVITIVTLMIFAMVAVWSANPPEWIPETAKVLGQALLTIVGAVLGAGANSRK